MHRLDLPKALSRAFQTIGFLGASSNTSFGLTHSSGQP